MSDAKVILSIDDDPDILDFMKTVLESKGYEVATAGTAEEGLKVYKQVNPDVVFVDLMMEEVDAGTAFVKELKALGQDVPIYMLSSVGDALNETTSYAALGLKGVLQKPLDPAKLVDLVKSAVG